MDYKTEKEVIERANKNKDWYNKSFAGYLFGIHEQGFAIAKATGSILTQPYGILFCNVLRQHHFDWFWDSEELRRKRKYILEEASKSKEFTDDFYKKWKKAYDAFVSYYERIIKKDIENLSDEELSEITEKVHELCIKQAGPGYVIDNFLTNDKEDWLIQNIKENLKGKATQEVISCLIHPIFNSFVNDYESEILKIAKMIKEKDEKKKIMKKCEDIAEKYLWFKTNYNDYQDMNAKIVYQEAENALSKNRNLEEEIDEKENGDEKNNNKKKKLYKEMHISNELQNIIHVSEIFTNIQDKRKECVLRVNYFYFKMLESISERFKKDKTVCYYLTIEEAIKVLSGGKIDWKDIEERSKSKFLCLFFNGKSVIMHEKEMNEKVKMNDFFPEHKDIKEFRGSVAYRGVVRGKVYILRNTKEISAFPEGGILVANQTTPEFVPAMKKAGAVVTDQGGITCHAAIVSRELKKPCIIGTKIATQILKDGMEIEVDADKGIVKILDKDTTDVLGYKR